jgi:hypothetical protein
MRLYAAVREAEAEQVNANSRIEENGCYIEFYISYNVKCNDLLLLTSTVDLTTDIRGRVIKFVECGFIAS